MIMHDQFWRMGLYAIKIIMFQVGEVNGTNLVDLQPSKVTIHDCDHWPGFFSHWVTFLEKFALFDPILLCFSKQYKILLVK